MLSTLPDYMAAQQTYMTSAFPVNQGNVEYAGIARGYLVLFEDTMELCNSWYYQYEREFGHVLCCVCVSMPVSVCLHL